jgi:hypothetical protein
MRYSLHPEREQKIPKKNVGKFYLFLRTSCSSEPEGDQVLSRERERERERERDRKDPVFITSTRLDASSTLRDETCSPEMSVTLTISAHSVPTRTPQ